MVDYSSGIHLRMSSVISVPVSVIIPCYSCSNVLARAVDSVLSQTNLPTELIIVDDASPDQGITKSCIDKIVDDLKKINTIKIRVISLEVNLGPAGARNVGWNLANQPYVAFLDSDDSWARDKLEVQYKWMIEHPEFSFSCHLSKHVNDITSQEIYDKSPPYWKINKYMLLLTNVVPTRSVMLVNNEKYRFPSNMRYAEDYHLWLNMIMSGVNMAIIRIPLAFTYKKIHEGESLSSNLFAMHKGVLLCFKNLLNQNLIGGLTYLFICLIEQLKYVKRLIYAKLN